MLNWCNRFNICVFLDNHRYQLPKHRYECLAGVGAATFIKANAGNALSNLQTFIEKQQDWCFGHIGYDIKNELESGLISKPAPAIGFPDLYFFVPDVLIQFSETECTIGSLADNHETIWQEINEQTIAASPPVSSLEIEERVSKANYLQTIGQLQQHILRGDCYELNYCMEFFSKHAAIEPVPVYHSLSELSPNPFSAFYKVDDSYLLCASPERYLQKKGDTLLSQPMKGTVRRNTSDPQADAQLKEQLLQSEKERSENVMVVDLVRNDMSRVCKEGSVTVEELFGIYSFPQVHQMVSTIKGTIADEFNFTDLIRATFPMGSMTGAPKRKVMQLLDQYEAGSRGIFSGAVGYLAPNGDFDFNVVIRSIMYNAATNYLSFMVGSGITWYANPEEEYAECLLKVEAIKQVIGKGVNSFS
jgi:para-aminobenzoate synthetase component 1